MEFLIMHFSPVSFNFIIIQNPVYNVETEGYSSNGCAVLEEAGSSVSHLGLSA
jgi:hypothetical protein